MQKEKLVKVVLKDKHGKELRSVEYPVKNAEKLINFNSGWGLSRDSNFLFKNGKLEEKQARNKDK